MKKASLKTRLIGRLGFLFIIPGLLCGLRTARAEESGSPGPNIHLRGNFLTSHFSFTARKKGHVAFIGGSITAMNGYRPMLCSFLQKRFPETKFTFTNAGISSTCSTSGAFRLQRDVLSKGPVDLFFIEYAVNDDQDAAHARRECLRGMEGILRQVRAHNPMADIVITHFVNPGMLKTVGQGKEPVSSGAHEDVAKHYGVSTIHLVREVDRLIAAGELTWRKFGGTHPGPTTNPFDLERTPGGSSSPMCRCTSRCRTTTGARGMPSGARSKRRPSRRTSSARRLPAWPRSPRA